MLNQLRTLSIRAKLTWIVISLLIIPWMGYHYVLEMRRFLVQGQQDALLLTANGIATVLNDRSELFNPATGVPKVLGEETDLFAHELDNPVQLDGQLGDWDELQEFASFYTGSINMVCAEDYDPDSFSLKHLLGFQELYLYAMFEVSDNQVVYRDLERVQLNTSDQIRMLLQLPDNTLRHYLMVARAPGRMSIYLVDEDWVLALKGDPVTAFTAEMAKTDHGYNIELRIPRDIIGTQTHIGFYVVDVDDPENRQIDTILNTSPQISGSEPAQILLSSPELTKILRGLNRPQSRIWILDQQQRVRAVVGGLSASPATDYTEPAEEIGWLTALYEAFQRRLDALFVRPTEHFTDIPIDVTHRPDKIFTTILKGTPKVAERPSLDQKAQIIVAGYPIRSGGDVLGAVIVEQSSHSILSLQYRLLRSLTLATVLVFVFVLLTLFVFAWRLTVRIRRLYNTTELSITAEGRVLEERIPTRVYPTDELGDLGRSITNMLHRLSGYTRYLEGMPDTLAHEMNNPLNVVSSSLEILQSDVPEIKDNKYMLRAQNGINRLRSILTSLTEAANLEEAMRDEIKELVNLSSLIHEFVDGYRTSFPHCRFQTHTTAQSIVIEGSADRLAQMLDKLIDNAVQFTRPETPIVVSLTKNNQNAEISVMNEGQEIPEKIIDRMFDPMVSYGKINAKHSHLGLGLFVVRLIAEYHQGKIRAENRTDRSGVIVTVSIPISKESVSMT